MELALCPIKLIASQVARSTQNSYVLYGRQRRSKPYYKHGLGPLILTAYHPPPANHPFGASQNVIEAAKRPRLVGRLSTTH